MPRRAWSAVVDYAGEVKKKFKNYGDEDAQRAKGMAEELGKLPDEEIKTLREGYPSNIHVSLEYKRRGLGKK